VRVSLYFGIRDLACWRLPQVGLLQERRIRIRPAQMLCGSADALVRSFKEIKMLQYREVLNSQKGSVSSSRMAWPDVFVHVSV